MNKNTLIQSFKYAFEGIYFAVKLNRNMRIHITVAIIVILASIYFKVSVFEMGILGVMIVLVISTEMINTALEEMVNLIINEHRKEAKIAKDVGAGMVLVASIGAVIIGFLVFIPHIIKLFK